MIECQSLKEKNCDLVEIKQSITGGRNQEVEGMRKPMIIDSVDSDVIGKAESFEDLGSFV